MKNENNDTLVLRRLLTEVGIARVLCPFGQAVIVGPQIGAKEFSCVFPVPLNRVIRREIDVHLVAPSPVEAVSDPYSGFGSANQESCQFGCLFTSSSQRRDPAETTSSVATYPSRPMRWTRPRSRRNATAT